MLVAWVSRKVRKGVSKTVLAISIVSALVFIAAVMISCGSQTEQNSPERPKPPADVRSFKISDRKHVKGHVSYPQTPPVGGPHNPVWQNCFFYDKPVPNENAVHSLEHGAVWITFRPDLPRDQIDKLRELAESDSYLLVSPYPGLPAPVVASAWGKQLRLDAANDPRLEQFVRAFEQGSQAPEPGNPCIGGTGQPG